MVVVVTTSMLAIFLTFISTYKINRIRFKCGMEIGFVLITFIACIQYNSGNDYMLYYARWINQRYMSYSELFKIYHRELGWTIINKLFSFKNGFYFLIAFLSIVQNYIYYKFITTFVYPKWRWLAVFIYLCSTQLYLFSFVILRQSFAMALFIASFFFIRRKKKIRSILLLMLAASFHTSATLCMPFIALSFYKNIPIRKYGIILVILLISFMSKNITSSIFKFLINFDAFEIYRENSDTTSSRLGIGFLIKTIPFVVSFCFILFSKCKLDKDEKIMTIISCVGLLIYPFIFVGATLLIRIVYYFTAFHVTVIPILYSKIKNMYLKYVLCVILILITSYEYINLFYSDMWRNSMMEYHTVFEVLK